MLLVLLKPDRGKLALNFSPSIVHINAGPFLQRGDGPYVLVLAPTRELAVQICEECTKFGCTSQIRNTCVYGGAPVSYTHLTLPTILLV